MDSGVPEKRFLQGLSQVLARKKYETFAFMTDKPFSLEANSDFQD